MTSIAVISPVEGAPGYFVSEDGQVYSERRGTRRRLSPGVQDHGHHIVTLMIDGRRVQRYVHALVAEAFVGPRLSGQEVRHLDGNPANNHASNLAYGTRQDNADDSRRHRTTPAGVRNGRAKLTPDLVAEIRSRSGESCAALAREFGVSPGAIYFVLRGETWQ